MAGKVVPLLLMEKRQVGRACRLPIEAGNAT